MLNSRSFNPVIISTLLVLCISAKSICQTASVKNRTKIEAAMLRATKYMVEKVSYQGGYVWYYTPDKKRRWGEIEATKTMIWLQDPGTPMVGNMLIDAYKTTGDEYYYQAAYKAAKAVIKGQSKDGGWNYLIDFAGEDSLKRWYNTIGKNAWRLEEFQHYYGNCTFDDNVSSETASFLLRLYLIKRNSYIKQALDKAIGFVLKSQYKIGAWPQRYPLRHDFKLKGNPDYSAYYTFNDDVIWQNIRFLMQCHLYLHQKRYIEPIRKAMNFYILSQDSSGGWGQQMDTTLQTAGARTYEPKALLPRNTRDIIEQLMLFYRLTLDKKYLTPIPKALSWLEASRLPDSLTENGRYSHPKFVELGSNKGIYPHRKGSNAIFGYYYTDYNSNHPLGHYGPKSFVDTRLLFDEYCQLSDGGRTIRSNNAGFFNKASLLKWKHIFDTEQTKYQTECDENRVSEIISTLNDDGCWLVKHGSTSHRYCGDGVNKKPVDTYCSTYVGDETDTSPFRDDSEQLYISTGEYVRNMKILINYLKKKKQ